MDSRIRSKTSRGLAIVAILASLLLGVTATSLTQPSQAPASSRPQPVHDPENLYWIGATVGPELGSGHGVSGLR